MARLASPDGTFTYQNDNKLHEKAVLRGAKYYVDRYQSTIDRAEDLGFDVANIQSAFDEISPLILTGDITFDRFGEGEWFNAAGQNVVKAFPNLDSLATRKKFFAINSLVIQTGSLSEICGDEVDDLIEATLFPAIDELLDSLK